MKKIDEDFARYGTNILEGIILDKLKISQTYESSVTVTQEMIELFANATGDYNHIHVDEDYAKATQFKTRIVHGLLLVGILSGILGMHFPGMGAIYISQTLKFLKPVFLGEQITFRLKY